MLAVNQQMTIPKSNVYTVRNDDTVDSVLAATNRSAIELLRANASTWLKSGTKIYYLHSVQAKTQSAMQPII